MTDHSTPQPPRLVPDRPFPPYAYRPGWTPHPTRDPDGHSYGAMHEAGEPPDPDGWRTCRDYLYGIDLFNHGFYWEAHEAWEELWVDCGRRGPTATYLQALINLAAAGFKARWGSARGMKANARTALRLFDASAPERGADGTDYMGLDVHALALYADTISQYPYKTGIAAVGGAPLSFDLILRPNWG